MGAASTATVVAAAAGAVLVLADKGAMEPGIGIEDWLGKIRIQLIAVDPEPGSAIVIISP